MQKDLGVLVSRIEVLDQFEQSAPVKLLQPKLQVFPCGLVLVV
jgi:hypothetical protein